MQQFNCTTESEASENIGCLDIKRASHIDRGPIGVAATAGNQVGSPSKNLKWLLVVLTKAEEVEASIE